MKPIPHVTNVTLLAWKSISKPMFTVSVFSNWVCKNFMFYHVFAFLNVCWISFPTLTKLELNLQAHNYPMSLIYKFLPVVICRMSKSAFWFSRAGSAKFQFTMFCAFHAFEKVFELFLFSITHSRNSSMPLLSYI